MKKIKSIVLAGLIAISSFAGIITASAAPISDDNTANFYITDSIDGDSVTSASEPSFTANVGDIVEISVSAKSTSDITDFCSIDIRTFFNQSSCDSHNTYDGNGILSYTKGYDDNSFYKLYDGFKNASIITNPDDEHYPSTRNSFIYTLSSVHNSGDFSSSQVLYRFTLEVTKSGDSYVNTTIRDIAHDYPDEYLKSEPNLLNTYTTMSVIKQAEKPTTEPTTEPVTTEPVTDPVPTETESVPTEPASTETEPITTEPTSTATEPTEETTVPTDIPTNPTETTVPVTEPIETTEPTTNTVPTETETTETTMPATEPTEKPTEETTTSPVTDPTERPTDMPTTSPVTEPDNTEPTQTEPASENQTTAPTESQTQVTVPTETQTTTPVNSDTATPDTATPDTAPQTTTSDSNTNGTANTTTNNNGVVSTGQTLPVTLIAIAMISAGICLFMRKRKFNTNK